MYTRGIKVVTFFPYSKGFFYFSDYRIDKNGKSIHFLTYFWTYY